MTKQYKLPKLFNFLTSSACLTFLFIQGCSNNSSIFSKDNLPLVHRVDIQQGNVITQDMLAKLKLGMEKKKVRFIMGTPLITDTFHNDRWDYIYTFKEGREQREQRRVTLFFEDDLLARIGGDVNPAQGEIQTDSRKVESVDVPPTGPPGIFSRIKEKLTFGKDKPKVDAENDDETVDTDKSESETETTGLSEDPDLEATAEEMTTKEATDTATTTNQDEEPSEEEENDFFGKIWDENDGDVDIDPNDPILNDPAINPDL